MKQRYLITGGCGFLGSNLAKEVLDRGETLCVFDNLSRAGSEENLSWLRTHGHFEHIQHDICNTEAVFATMKKFQPDTVFHVAGQVAMTTSIINPRLDFNTNILGSFNLLEAVRLYAPETVVIYSSTNKVYGDLEMLQYMETDSRYVAKDFPQGFDETLPLEFRTPYGCSKGAADQYIRDYARVFGLRTLVFRHSSMYGGRQFPTFDQGWIGWFCKQALLKKRGILTDNFSISGNGKQVRDVLHAEDMKRLYFSGLSKIDNNCGQVFNIGGGLDNSLSLLELFDILEQHLHISLQPEKQAPRESDQKVFVADISKAETRLNWQPQISKETGIADLLEWLQTH